ncbi:uncharacterized protein LOC117570798 [Drosophila albomicans]|uniref:Uncharacterized protein LOC117570798 n=1 Tax=Drosophila albomicans TaxID=7291 RepID=A0A6P8XB15_DROAB|nr:uncharacterized protein LOC117570798 [Drosophila albomicans]
MSVIAGPPKAGIEEAIPVWMKIDWPPEIVHNIFKNWGTYYALRRQDSNSIEYFTKAMELDDTDYLSIYGRSQIKRMAARLEGALADAKLAAELAKKQKAPNVLINFEYCCDLFELNQLEHSKIEISNNLKLFKDITASIFKEREIVIDSVIQDATGKAMSLFLLQNQKLVEKVFRINEAKARVDRRLLWKIQREEKKCDVLSVLEEVEEILSPLEIARRKRAFNIVHQTYMNKTWIDFVFMRLLTENKSLHLDQCKRSHGFLQKLVFEQYKIIREFVKMIQTRSPLYYVNYIKFRNLAMLMKSKQAYLYRTQYQLHRNMIAHLKEIHRLRKEKRLQKLVSYVEKIMGKDYVKRTNRVMCWKFEFVNEVYNISALALTEQYSIPKNFRPSNASMVQLLHLPADTIKEIVPFVFGDRSTHDATDTLDIEGKKLRKRISHLENLIRFTNFSIEKCYLYYQISDVYLSQGHSEECCFNARKAIKESEICNNLIWKFLSNVQIIKANRILHKVERVGEALEKTLPIAEQLCSSRLVNFIEICIICNELEITKKSNASSHGAFSYTSINYGEERQL